jgi:hypothetical protein
MGLSGIPNRIGSIVQCAAAPQPAGSAATNAAERPYP